MSLVYGVEKLDRCWNELMVIASQHWNETEGFRRGEPFAPSFSRYAECERIGFFTMFTARDGEKLVGYAGMYTTQSMHSQVTIATFCLVRSPDRATLLFPCALLIPASRGRLM